MPKITLYHSSYNSIVEPKFSLEESCRDFGEGLYLTGDIQLAKEWAVSNPKMNNGYVHAFELEMDGLKVLDFQQHDILCWLAELMKHREASDSKRYRVLAKQFIEKYGIDTDEYDVIKGWRANASYFYIAKEFVRDNIDVEILEELLCLGGLGIQYCIKSKKAYDQLTLIPGDMVVVDYKEFNDAYNERDRNARDRMRELIDSDKNRVENVFSTILRGE